VNKYLDLSYVGNESNPYLICMDIPNNLSTLTMHDDSKFLTATLEDNLSIVTAHISDKIKIINQERFENCIN
jgi:hypothetical protein